MRWIDPLSGAVKQQEKVCCRCKRTKSIEAFPWRKANERRPYEGPAALCYACERLRRAAIRAKRPKRVNPNIIYTPAVLAELRACIEAGMTAEETAAKMGLSVSSVKNARGNHGLPKFRKIPRISPERALVPTIARLTLSGASYRQIGARIGKSRNSVSGIIFRHRQQFNLELQAYASRPQSRQSMDAR